MRESVRQKRTRQLNFERAAWGVLLIALLGSLACSEEAASDVDAGASGGTAGSGTSSGGALPGSGGSISGGTGASNAGGSGGGEASGGASSGGSTAGGAGGLGAIGEHGWELVWSDEFDGVALDTTKWQHEVNCWGGGNNEQQCYVADAKNAFVENGELHLVALADSPTGAVGGPDGSTEVVTLPYSSARLNTSGLASFRYGRFEARLKLPEGQGLWPAFWMLPTDSVYGGWARSGEIDIMEAVNSFPSNNLVYGTLHYGGSWPDNVHTGTEYDPPSYVADTFFTYAVEWEEGEIRWFVDEVLYATQTEWHSDGSDFPAPFDQDFHLLLNVAVGGEWPGPPDQSTTFPQEMVVDFVRVYRCSHDPETGKPCGSTASP